MAAQAALRREPASFLPLLRETAIGSVPVVVALLLPWLLGRADPLVLGLGFVAGVVAALALADARCRQTRAVAGWLSGLAAGERWAERPPTAFATAVERLLWPALDLARALRRAERRTATQQRLLHAVVEALPDPVLVVDRRLTILWTNEAARSTFRLPAGEMPLVRALRDPAVLAAVNAALTAGSGGSVLYSPVGDRLKQFAVRIEPVDTGESGRAVLIALRERTEQVMIERMRADFVANAGHEIKTPLAAIVGAVETLRGPARDDPAAREMLLATAADETGRMARLVEDLLSLSRIELAERRPPDGTVEPVALVRQVEGSLRPVAARTGVDLELELPEVLPPLRGDPDQLHQALANLVDNAIKYGGPGKPVRIAARLLAAAGNDAGPLSGRPCIEIVVADRGEGIAREHLPRLTERFYRIDRARSRRIGGTGLGLAIVKHIVRRHRGHLRIESEIGRGSRFAILLPLEAPG